MVNPPIVPPTNVGLKKTKIPTRYSPYSSGLQLEVDFMYHLKYFEVLVNLSFNRQWYVIWCQFYIVQLAILYIHILYIYILCIYIYIIYTYIVYYIHIVITMITMNMPIVSCFFSYCFFHVFFNIPCLSIFFWGDTTSLRISMLGWAPQFAGLGPGLDGGFLSHRATPSHHPF